MKTSHQHAVGAFFARRLCACFSSAAVVLSLCLAWPDKTLAQTAAATRSSTSQIAEARRLLRDPDANVRTAAMENLVFSENLALREMAFDEGFSSADSVIRSLALIGRLHSTQTLVFEVMNAKNMAPAEWTKLLASAQWGERLNFLEFKLDPKTGQVAFRGGTGRLAGQAMNLVWGHHSLSARLTDGAILMGTVSHGQLTLPVRAVLQ